VLRTCPEAVRRWSRAEVARRWLTITKLAKCLSDDLPKPDPRRAEQLAKDTKKIDKLRLRLCSVSMVHGRPQRKYLGRGSRVTSTGGLGSRGALVGSAAEWFGESALVQNHRPTETSSRGGERSSHARARPDT
jgi:hypothetical protein